MSATLPKVALSLRQPWAWLVIHAGKDIENRKWSTKFRGECLIHASKGMTRDEYRDVRDWLQMKGMQHIALPKFEDLSRGGLVGVVTITDCVAHHPSRWFFGPYGFVIEGARPLPFMPCKGSLGFFNPMLP
jgi:hypothetical protein